MIEVRVRTDSPNLVRETLNRIGVVDRQKKVIYPSVYLHEVEGKFFLIHFKEWFLINRDDSFDNVSDEDKNRVAYVAMMLFKWGIVEPVPVLNPKKDSKLSVIKSIDLKEYTIKHKVKF